LLHGDPFVGRGTAHDERQIAEPVALEDLVDAGDILVRHLDDGAQFLGEQGGQRFVAQLIQAMLNPCRPPKAISARVTNNPPSDRS